MLEICIILCKYLAKLCLVVYIIQLLLYFPVFCYITPTLSTIQTGTQGHQAYGKYNLSLCELTYYVGGRNNLSCIWQTQLIRYVNLLYLTKLDFLEILDCLDWLDWFTHLDHINFLDQLDSLDRLDELDQLAELRR